MAKRKKETETSVNEEVFTGNPFVQDEGLQARQATMSITSRELAEAINVLITAVNYAQGKGIYNLQEASDIWKAIEQIHRILQPNQN